jgi:hypothetical protein
MTRRLVPALTLMTVALVPFPDHAQPAADEYWSGWRQRQRAEFAGLPAAPQPPAGTGSAVDRFVTAHWAQHGFKPPAVIGDRAFARRVCLDVVGLPPTPAQLAAFEQDGRQDKRTRLVDELLADKDGYAEGWMAYWNDLLRNDEQTTVDGLRKPITEWLYVSLRDNKPLDLFVAELLHPGKHGPTGYLQGVNWRGTVNSSQTPPVQAAQNVAQVFLAASLKCASCHNSFINEYKLDQAYGMASFFAPKNLEMHRCDKPTGKTVAPKFLIAGLGEVAADADLETRHKAVAQMVTRPKNTRFAQAMVNRLWKKVMGRGLFEPADDFDGKTPHLDLLNWLAHDFIAHDYDVKHTLRLILLSQVYQLPVSAKEDGVLRGPSPRRLTSEQYLDAVSEVTGYWPKVQTMKVAVPNPNIRAWRHKRPDVLETALGRPTREQVCTQRPQDSSVLQALELVNGKELTARLQEGVKKLLVSPLGKENDADKVVRELFLRALSREPNEKELALARPLIGTPQQPAAQRQEGWEDLVWVLVMGPEMQFVR